MSGSVAVDKTSAAVDAVENLVGSSVGVAPPIGPVWDVVSGTWEATKASVQASKAQESRREGEATFEQVQRLEKKAAASVESLHFTMAYLVLWPFLTLLLLIAWPLAIPSWMPRPARMAISIAYYGLMAWLFPTWLLPMLFKQLAGWWQWAIILFQVGPILGALLTPCISWLVTRRRRT